MRLCSPCRGELYSLFLVITPKPYVITGVFRGSLVCLFLCGLAAVVVCGVYVSLFLLVMILIVVISCLAVYSRLTLVQTVCD
jgi:hypothetical protein